MNVGTRNAKNSAPPVDERSIVRRLRGCAACAQRCIGLAALLTAIAAVAGPSGASALIARLGSTAVGYRPIPAAPSSPAQNATASRPASEKTLVAVSPLEYHGGPVMATNSNYALYWIPPTAPGLPSGYQNGIDRYFEDLAHASGGIQNTDSLLVQYGVQYTSAFAGALIDTNPYPANGCSAAPICLTDAQLRAELTRYVSEHQLASDLRHEYFMLTPPSVESCLEAAGHSCSAGTKHSVYCAYHGYIPVAGGVLVYANIPYMNGTGCDTGEEHPNGNPSDATLGGGLVHEHSESVTDPELNAWYDSQKEEVADKCRTFKATTEFGEPLGKAPNGSNYNEVINGDLYLYPQMWSNQTSGCAQRAALPPPRIKKMKPKNGPATGGTSVTITGANFAGEVTVRFGASPPAQATVVSATTITAVAPPGEVGTVDVTVTTASGTSAIVKGDRFKYKKAKA